MFSPLVRLLQYFSPLKNRLWESACIVFGGHELLVDLPYPGYDAEFDDGERIVLPVVGGEDVSSVDGGDELVHCISVRVVQSEVDDLEGFFVGDLRVDV